MQHPPASVATKLQLDVGDQEPTLLELLNNNASLLSQLSEKEVSSCEGLTLAQCFDASNKCVWKTTGNPRGCVARKTDTSYPINQSLFEVQHAIYFPLFNGIQEPPR